MKKLLISIIIFFYTNLAAQNTVKISSGTESYIDPEVLSEQNLMTFQTSSGKVWVAEIDSVTGLFKSNFGLNFFADSNAVKTSQTFNGPEFGVSKNGWAVFYTKPSNSVSQIWQADFSDDKFTSYAILSDQQRRQTALVSKNSNSESIRVLYVKGRLSDGLMFWSDVTSPQQETLIDSVDKGIRWIDETNSLVYVKQSGQFKGQLTIYDTDTKSEKIITNDSLSKSFPYAWFAPEYHNEPIALALIDGNTKIGIYKDNGGQYWEKVQEIIVPYTSAYKYFGSPEPFVVAGKSYISCVIKEIADAYSNSEVWIFGLQQGENKTYARKIEDDLGTIIRSDPETYLGENEVFVYYNVLENGVFNIYRSRTDLITLSVIKDENEIPMDYKLYQNYPNPFNPATTIRFSLPKTEYVTLKVFDVLGNEIETLVDRELNFGEHSIVFDAKNFPSGVYFYQLKTNNFVKQRKMEVLK
ncbi:MAG: T9SS type A sorting domain-containing protein [Stygiobacter sp.]